MLMAGNPSCTVALSGALPFCPAKQQRKPNVPEV